jgi:alcohol dehydrogenase (cytochrome c)
VARPGDNLFTCSLIALDVDTGKMKWYFQTSAHDTHDWDSAQTPVLFDAVVNGRPRKLVSTASRNGYFYTLDRVTGEHLVTAKIRTARQLGQRLAADGRRRAEPGKEATIPAPSSHRSNKV